MCGVRVFLGIKKRKKERKSTKKKEKKKEKKESLLCKTSLHTNTTHKTDNQDLKKNGIKSNPNFFKS